VKTPADFQALKRRYRPSTPSRYPAYWDNFGLEGWRAAQHVLMLGRNCSTLGYYWRAREWMGTEALSYAWYDEPALMHEMMEFITDFTIETARPVLARPACARLRVPQRGPEHEERSAAQPRHLTAPLFCRR
jgi:hypothetical protein